MQPQILNVDILDDKEPMVLVQRYIYPDRTFQVFRKQTSQDEEFELSPGIEIDPDLYWRVPSTLFMSLEDLNVYSSIEVDDAEDDEETDDDFTYELFAVVCLDEENPPAHDPDEPSEHGMECLSIAYDVDSELYRCEPTLLAHESLQRITATTLDDALVRGIDALHAILASEAKATGA